MVLPRFAQQVFEEQKEDVKSSDSSDLSYDSDCRSSIQERARNPEKLEKTDTYGMIVKLSARGTANNEKVENKNESVKLLPAVTPNMKALTVPAR